MPLVELRLSPPLSLLVCHPYSRLLPGFLRIRHLTNGRFLCRTGLRAKVLGLMVIDDPCSLGFAENSSGGGQHKLLNSTEGGSCETESRDQFSSLSHRVRPPSYGEYVSFPDLSSKYIYSTYHLSKYFQRLLLLRTTLCGQGHCSAPYL